VSKFRSCPVSTFSNRFTTHLATLVASAACFAFAQAAPPEMQWPPIRKECQPWTYWWWLGSAVDRNELTRHLTAYHEAGLGGVHIVPIYGAKGHEDRYIDYLTHQWMEMLAYTVAEAGRLGMGVDMTTGTGWPFGGPWVAPQNAAAKVLFETYSLNSGESIEQPIQSTQQPAARLQTLMAFPQAGDPIDLTGQVGSSGQLDWTPDSGRWRLYAVFQGWTKQQVKRAAPGAEGLVLDYFSTRALNSYLTRFDEAFANYRAEPPRAFYNDSYEVYGANWTDRLLVEFTKRRGYDLRHQLPALLGEGPTDRISRVRSDYRETIADLLMEDFTRPWVAWAHRKGAITRSQAHGSPGNILDLYAAADIPETEGWQSPGANILVSKIASSAAHLHGKRLVSSESCTWLGEHFQVALADVKGAIDRLLLSGVNHVFYHGMPFSPSDAPYPGWLFYAATHFGPTNSFYRDLADVNQYIARCQSFLQMGEPDEDVLLYLPMYDLYAAEHGAKFRLQCLTMHNYGDWLETNLAATHRVARTMWDRGYSFDYVSDHVITSRLAATHDGIQAGRQRYLALVVAGCQRMPLETLAALIDLAGQGATIIVVGSLPPDVPGLGHLEQRRKRHHQLLANITARPTGTHGVNEARIGIGRFLVGEKLELLLRHANVAREPLVDHGLAFVRRADCKGHHYFIVNLTDEPFDGWAPLHNRAEAVIIFDPQFDRCGVARIRGRGTDHTEVRVQVQAGQSVVLRTLADAGEGQAWTYLTETGPGHTLTGPWQVTFIEGGPTRPASFTTDRLCSWTELKNKQAHAFSGTARYEITFHRPARPARDWVLDLGQVHASARVRVNGQPVATLWSRPFRVPIGHALCDGQNTLEIEVTNLMANRIADMDRRRIPWKIYFFVNIDYGPFDASSWEPLLSGLLGPVRLIPCTEEP